MSVRDDPGYRAFFNHLDGRSETRPIGAHRTTNEAWDAAYRLTDGTFPGSGVVGFDVTGVERVSTAGQVEQALQREAANREVEAVARRADARRATSARGRELDRRTVGREYVGNMRPVQP